MNELIQPIEKPISSTAPATAAGSAGDAKDQQPLGRAAAWPEPRSRPGESRSTTSLSTAGRAVPQTREATASPIAGEVWMPVPPWPAHHTNPSVPSSNPTTG